MLCRRLLALCVVWGLIAVALPARSQDKDKAELKWKFEKDKVFWQEMTTETNQNMKISGMEIGQKQKQTFIFSWSPVEQDADKNWVLKQKIEAVKMDIDIGGNKITYDSTSPTPSNNPLGDFFKVMVGAEFTLTVSPEMKITKIDGREKFLDSLTKANPQMKTLLDAILSDKAMEQMADPLFAAVPHKEVTKGETWKRDGKLNLGPIGSYETSHEYTYEGPEKGLHKIKVAVKLKYTAPTEQAASGLPFRIKSADLQSKEAGGLILFDRQKGRVESGEIGMTLEGKLTIEIAGMSNDVELKQTQKTTFKITDKDPIGKK
ncbi:MAG: DUF6263 family protein [Gemmataceae bacterium]|nr:DUF6263 family protein [Gemmataceae bacterium]MDW8266481.1 DUF6263 family protein [Gemmataceae bacterium]